MEEWPHATFKAFGALVIYFFRNHQNVSSADIRGYYNRQYEEARKKYREEKPSIGAKTFFSL